LLLRLLHNKKQSNTIERGRVTAALFYFSRMQVTYSGSANLDNIITLSELKGFLRVENTAEDTFITALRAAAVTWVEDYCNTRLGSYTATFRMDNFFNSSFPVGPLTALAHVKYDNSAGVETTLPAGNYYYDIDSQPARIGFESPPTVEDFNLGGVRIETTAGWADTAIPEPFTQSIRMLVGHWYEHRTAVTQSGAIPRSLALGVNALLSPLRYIAVV